MPADEVAKLMAEVEGYAAAGDVQALRKYPFVVVGDPYTKKSRLPDRSRSSLDATAGHFTHASRRARCARWLDCLGTNHNRARAGRFQQVSSAGQPFLRLAYFLQALSVDD